MSVWVPDTCRACLVTNVKMYNIHDKGMSPLFGFIAGSPVEPNDGNPQHICYLCYSQLLKFKEFRHKCRQATAMFYDGACVVVRNNETVDGEDSTTSIRMIQTVPPNYTSSLDETKYLIPLSKTKNLILECIPKNVDVKETERIDVKIYSLKDVPNSCNYLDNEGNESGDLYICDDEERKDLDEKNEPNELINILNEKNIFDVEISVKNEIIDEADVTAEPFDEFKKETEALSDSEVTNVVKVKNKRKKIKNNVRDKIKSDRKIKQKKCNRYNEKFEEDFVEFSKSHDVKVVCLSKEEQIRKVQERKDSKEFKDSRFSCNICYKWFMSETAHKRHMKAHDPSSGSFVCDVCSMRYPTQHNLNTHARAHRKIFQCTLCDQANVCITRAKLHSRWHKGVKFECTVCHKEFNANTTYLNHMRECHKPVSCVACGKDCLGTNELTKHRQTAHKDKQNECDRCLVIFQCSEALARHRRDEECSGENTLKLKPCLLCGENFSCRSSLSEHMRQKHSGDGDTFTCEQCQSVFTSDRALSAHFGNAHYSLKPRANKQTNKQEYLCEWCAKSFPTALRLRQHHLLHSDDRPFQCSLCPKLLKTKAGLEFHMNSHTGLRPYKCRVCSETFKSHAHRHNHLVTKHTTRERRHKCESCDKSFVTSSDLKKHVRYVHLRHPRPTNRINKHKAAT